mmetsp:Transcript_44674/g.173222  ORF Transcript_44674/g.173222 Transcript_44674/m.173222 type:complete len:132 (+) Transcript_44674:68-463(+)
MGVGSSTANKLDKALATDLPEDEKYFGLENFGNTCYCNSVLQALYFCEPFRKQVLLYDRDRKERIRHNAEQQKILNGNGSHAASGLKSAVKGRKALSQTTLFCFLLLLRPCSASQITRFVLIIPRRSWKRH